MFLLYSVQPWGKCSFAGELRCPSASSNQMLMEVLMLVTALSHSSAAPRSNSERLRHTVLSTTFSVADVRNELEEEPALLMFRSPFQSLI